jgi:hypothetical protein
MHAATLPVVALAHSIRRQCNSPIAAQHGGLVGRRIQLGRRHLALLPKAQSDEQSIGNHDHIYIWFPAQHATEHSHAGRIAHKSCTSASDASCLRTATVTAAMASFHSCALGSIGNRSLGSRSIWYTCRAKTARNCQKRPPIAHRYAAHHVRPRPRHGILAAAHRHLLPRVRGEIMGLIITKTV